MVTRQNQIQALGLGSEAVVKAKLPREEDIRFLADRVGNEIPAGAADNRNAPDCCCRLADDLNSRGEKYGLGGGGKSIQAHGLRERAYAAFARGQWQGV